MSAKGKEQDFKSFISLISERVCRVSEMKTVQWSITGTCNAKCRHCFITESQNSHKYLSTNEMIRILEALAEKHIYNISITGGEPLTRSDLSLLLDEMVKRGQKVTHISTNGFLLTDKMIALFKDHGMVPKVQISFDGVGHHDWMRGIDGAEKMAIAAMDACRRNGIYCVISMCLHKENAHLLVPTIQMAAEHGVAGVRVSPVSDFGGFKGCPGMTLFSEDEVLSCYLDAVPEILKSKLDIYVEFCGFVKFSCKNPKDYKIIPMIHNCTNTKDNSVCSAIRQTCYISDEGRLIPCISVAGSSIEKEFYKLTEHSFNECMESPAYKKFLNLHADDLISQNPECALCEYLSYCGCGCRGASVSLSGEYYGIDLSRCLFFKNHWPDKIKSVMESVLNPTSFYTEPKNKI